MGNCQAAEVATVVIQHPGGKVERVYWSVSASRVMADNPGHYVAVIITAPASSGGDINNKAGSKHSRRKKDPGPDGHAPAVKHLKLLRPDDTLLMGHVYRLVSFEEVVRKFETKRHAKLAKFATNSGNVEMSTSSAHGRRESRKEGQGGHAMKAESEKNPVVAEAVRDKSDEDEEADELVSVAQALISAGNNNSSLGSRRSQWKPALQSISEVTGT
ncbi:D-ribose-binding periplasmic protein [Rhynchospora pubera]|uniref:D-ribose-binding periplasmic protein n=1 Tax=Rhynchospora pubera TaxID=906938 RepID=A0AAV8CH85_9POAL|nr:D-ribose-binding periplasmic protein [Rhynchospora pubera]